MKSLFLFIFIFFSFTACMDDSPEDVAKKYMNYLKNGDYNSILEVVSDDMALYLANNAFFSCIINVDIKNKVTKILEDDGIDIDNYNNLPENQQKKVIEKCFKESSRLLDNVSTYNILTSKLDSKTNTMIITIKIKLNSGEAKQENIILERIEDKYKVVQ